MKKLWIEFKMFKKSFTTALMFLVFALLMLGVSVWGVVAAISYTMEKQKKEISEENHDNP